MKQLLYLLYICMCAGMAVCPVGARAQLPFEVEPPKRETRAVWLTTYGALDWPKAKATSLAGIRAQQDELRRILDRLKAANFNTVLFQTRIRGTVVYPSAFEPWDACLTGTTGRSPGYDPLAFAVEECHKRGLELHAWVVAIPYCKVAAAKQLGAKSVLKRHPGLCIRHADTWYLDPAQPATADYLAAICREIVSNYDVDGIHFDYIRYPENASRFNDRASYRRHGKGRDKSAWRRDNITRCVRTLYRAIKSVKPWVKVSSAPIGKFSDLSRYPSNGWNAYAAVHQDAQGWLREGIHDMLFPMMYFRNNHFFPFAADWKENDCGRPVVPGLGIYFLSPREKDWPLEDITRELHVVRSLGMGGQAYFRYAFLEQNHKGLFDYLKEACYAYPALPAACRLADTIPPAVPGALRAVREGARFVLRWSPPADAAQEAGLRYNVYAAVSEPVDIASARHLVAVAVDSCSFPLDAAYCALHDVRFAVTAMDRAGNEGMPACYAPSQPVAATVGRRFLPHKDGVVEIPARDAPFVAFVDLYGRIVDTAPCARQLRVGHLPKGIYQVRTLGRKGRSSHIGYFIK